MPDPSPARPPTSRRSRIAAGAAAVFLAVAAPRIYAQALRIGVVDVQRALLETQQGQRAKNQLKQLFQRRQEQLDARQQELRRMREELERERNRISQDEMRRRMEEYQKQFVELQQNFVEYQQELAQREAELTKQIFVNLETVIRSVGMSENYTVIFDQSGVVWSPQHLDLTDRIVQLYNQRYPATSEPAAGRTDAGAPAPRATGDAGAPAPRATGDAGVQGRQRVNPHPRGEQEPGRP